MIEIFRKFFVRILQLPIRFYRLFFSPWVGMNCRYQPTCSVYGLEALEKHGPVKGVWLTAKRVLSCHPFGGSGYDPVPDKEGSRESGIDGGK